jgi:thioredoxin-like negative regulator of GroEL
MNTANTANTAVNTRALEERLAASERTLVIITAEWCGHCHALIPEIQKIKDFFKNHTNTAKFEHVDYATVEPSFLSTLGVNAFPTIILTKFGETYTEYQGARAYSSIVNFATSTSMLGPPVIKKK